MLLLIFIERMSIQDFGRFHLSLLQASRHTRQVGLIDRLSILIEVIPCLVCMGKTQTKAIVALILQSISIFVLLVVIGFLIAFMASNFTLCLGFQCYQNSTTFASYLNDTYLPYSSYNYTILKRAFIVSELVCSFVYIVFAVMYILLFIRCLKKLPKTPPVALAVPQTSPAKIHMTSHTQRTTTHVSNISSIGQLPSAKSSLTVTNPSAPNSPYYRAQKVCPNCKHVSPYVPEKNIVECPNCHYQSPYVEHAQQS